MELDKTWIKRFEKAIRQAEVEMVVELGQAKVKIKELLNLKVGDTLMLESDAKESLVAKVQGVPKYRGRSGLYGSSKAFQIEARIEPGH
jgi:flagellar motor switch protein FliM